MLMMMITNRFVYCLLEIDSIDMCMYVCKSSNDKQIEIEEEEKKINLKTLLLLSLSIFNSSSCFNDILNHQIMIDFGYILYSTNSSC